MPEQRSQINQTETFVRRRGHGPKQLLIVHGWGVSSDSWKNFEQHFPEEEYSLFLPDMPGFGQSSPPSFPWTLEEYGKWIVQLAEKLKLENYTYLGHSFGGRIGLKLVGDLAHRQGMEYLRPFLPKKLILCAAAGLKDYRWKKRLKRIFFGTAAKAGNTILTLIPPLQRRAKKLLYRAAGEHDYEQANPIMQQVMKLALKEDLRPFLKNIKLLTLIAWGEQDTYTPLRDAHEMKQKIQASQLITFPTGRHNFYKYVSEDLAKNVKAFQDHS